MDVAVRGSKLDAHMALRAESALRGYGLRLAQDDTAKAKKRAVAAVARKVAVAAAGALEIPSTRRTCLQWIESI